MPLFIPKVYPPEFLPTLVPSNLPARRCPTSVYEASKRILIMRVGASGDIAMGTPVISALRSAYPEAYITWVVEHGGRQIIDAHPDVDDLLLFHGAFWKQLKRYALLPLPLVGYHALKLRAELRRRKYDIFICYQPEEWPLFTKNVSAPISIGVFDTFRMYHGNAPTSPYTSLFTNPYTYKDLPPHRVDQYCLALKALGIDTPVRPRMSLGYTDNDLQAVRAWLAAQGVEIASQRIILIAPFTTWPSRCWPVERYAEIGDRLAQESGSRIVLIGSPKEKNGVKKLADVMQCRPILAAGELSLRQLIALIDISALLVSGDTGPMHIAAAVQTPNVAIFGPTAGE